VLRNTPYLSYPLWRFRLLTRLERSGKQPAARKIARVRPGLRGGQGTVCLQVQPEEPPLPAHCFDPHTVCVETGSPLMGPTYCLDADNGQMVSMDLRPWREDPNPLEARDEYVSIGEGRYPKHIVSTSGADTLEVRVQKIELVRRFADDVFVPPAGSYQQDWCPSPEIKETKGTTVDAQSLLSNLIPLGPPRLHVFYYRVDAQGQIEGVAEFNSDGTLKVISQDRLGASRLAIHSCSGKPVAYEDISVLAARKNMLLSDGFWLGTWVALPQPRRP